MRALQKHHRSEGPTARPRWLLPMVGGLGLLAAIAAAAGQAFGIEMTADRLPAAPWWVVVLGGIVSTGWAFWANRDGARASQVVVGGAALVAMLAGSLVLVPHNLLFAIVWVLQLINPGYNAFDVVPGPEAVPPLIAHLLAVAASAVLAYATLRVWRQVRGRCPACGRVHAEPMPVRRRWLIGFGVLSIVACLPYGLLKLAWSFGSDIGKTGNAFEHVEFDSPGFGDTVLLTAVSIGASLCMLLRVDWRWLRPVLTLVGGIGTVMLLPIGVIGAAMALMQTLGLMTTDVTELAPWVFHMVYVGFFVWGVGLSGLTLSYVRVTARTCERHVVQGSRDQSAGQNRSRSASIVRSSGSEIPTTL